MIRPEEAGVLYSLVFGEGVMNDATSVAILRAVQARRRQLQRQTRDFGGAGLVHSLGNLHAPACRTLEDRAWRHCCRIHCR